MTQIDQTTELSIEKFEPSESLKSAFGAMCGNDLIGALSFSSMFYSTAGALSADYNGGMWDFYRISNGGVFGVPDKTTYKTRSPNVMSFELSNTAFGALVTLMACSNAYDPLIESEHNDAVAENYHRVYEYIQTLPEAGQIREFLD